MLIPKLWIYALKQMSAPKASTYASSKLFKNVFMRQLFSLVYYFLFAPKGVVVVLFFWISKHSYCCCDWESSGIMQYVCTIAKQCLVRGRSCFLMILWTSLMIKYVHYEGQVECFCMYHRIKRMTENGKVPAPAEISHFNSGLQVLKSALRIIALSTCIDNI